VRLLIDTQVVLWELSESRAVGAKAKAAMARAEELLFSVVSFVEVGIKSATGKLTVPPDFRERVERDGLRTLALTAEHGLALGRLPLHHRDPFDRLLVVQAMTEGLTLLTADARLSAYDVPVLDALA
jgi:PIN domain nuclease of toxin-antitoxin system